MELILVFIVLAVITASFRFFGLKYYKKISAEEALLKERMQREIEAAKAKDLSSLEESGDELIAVITAAVEAVLCKSVHIRQIKFLQNTNDSAWARMGRLSVMSSHQLK